MALTHVVSIGNSDDKLTQEQWSKFCEEVVALVKSYGKNVFFIGYTGPAQPWQSATFVFEPWDGDETLFLQRLRGVLATYRQDSAAVVVGETKFVRSQSVTTDAAGNV